MRSARTLLAAALGALAWLGCTDDPAGPPPPPPPDSPELILSDAVAPGSASVLTSITGAGQFPVAYLSLPPGTIPDAEYVIIRNLTDGNPEGLAVAVADGGFDPVVVVADEGDRLELEFHGDGTILGRKYGTVPRSRPPAIVRIAPPKGRTDVALAVRPTVVFSEPVDPASLAAAVRLLRGGTPVAGQVATRDGESWTVEFIPDALLEASVTYELHIAPTVRDLDGETLGAAAGSHFTTGTLAPPPPTEPPPTEPPPTEPPPGAPAPTGRIAFVSTRHGGPWIYTASANGSSVAPLVAGESPAWSPDGQSIAFSRGTELRVIGSDGLGERLLATDARHPTWSPDGTRLAYTQGTWDAIRSINADGTDDRHLLAPSDLGPAYLAAGQPAWSPDGATIAFTAQWWDWDGTGEIWLINPDGTNPRMLEGTGPVDDMVTPYTSNGLAPSWSPDGTSIAFQTKRWLGGPFEISVVSRRADGSGPLAFHFRSGPSGMMPNPIGRLDWSPDGRLVGFERWSSTGAFPHRIDVVDTQTGSTARLVPEASGGGIVLPYTDGDIAWSRVTP